MWQYALKVLGFLEVTYIIQLKIFPLFSVLPSFLIKIACISYHSSSKLSRKDATGNPVYIFVYILSILH